jgi:hypothetical protein
MRLAQHVLWKSFCHCFQNSRPAREIIANYRVSLHFLQRLLSLSHSSLTPFRRQRKHMTSPNIRYVQTTLGNLRFAAPILPLGRNLIVHDGSVGTICPQAIPAWQPIGLEFAAAWAADTLPFNYTAAVVS